MTRTTPSEDLPGARERCSSPACAAPLGHFTHAAPREAPPAAVSRTGRPNGFAVRPTHPPTDPRLIVLNPTPATLVNEQSVVSPDLASGVARGRTAPVRG